MNAPVPVMPVANTELPIVRFGDVVLDIGKRELVRKGRPVAIEYKALNLLIYLMINREHAVCRYELQRALWDGRPLSSTVLARCVMKARRAAGDDGTAQRVIKTISRYGYRFVAALVTTA